MQRISGIADMRARVVDWQRAGLRVGFVPTMGNLHGGHLALVDKARALSDRVVVSIFVNPAQFGPNEDYATYPRTGEADCAALDASGVDCVFLPAVDAMYPDGAGPRTRVEVPELNGMLCDVSRPGFFNGVATVVAKLLNIVTPDLAVFGLKDYQQLLVVQRLVRDLNLPVDIIGGPIAREPDGLAMSSRNVYLTADERERAPALYRALCHVASRLERGEPDWPLLVAEGLDRLREAGMQPDYLEIRRADDLAEALTSDHELVIPGAAYLGRARLIDNVRVSLPTPGQRD